MEKNANKKTDKKAYDADRQTRWEEDKADDTFTQIKNEFSEGADKLEDLAEDTVNRIRDFTKGVTSKW